MGILSIFSGPKKKTILFVEDDKEIISNYESLLTSDPQMTREFDFIFVTDKNEFMANFSKADAVVSDYYMPGLKFETVWMTCEGKVPLTLISGEILKKFQGPQVYKPVSYKNLKSAILSMMEKNVPCPKFQDMKKTVPKAA